MLAVVREVLLNEHIPRLYCPVVHSVGKTANYSELNSQCTTRIATCAKYFIHVFHDIHKRK